MVSIEDEHLDAIKEKYNVEPFKPPAYKPSKAEIEAIVQKLIEKSPEQKTTDSE